MIRKVFFDCDSTLVSIEGIVQLAEWRGLGREVAALTSMAMRGEVPMEAVFEKRLDQVRPDRDLVQRLGRAYVEHLVEDAAQVIRALHHLKKAVYIVSAGFTQAIRPLAEHLSVPPERSFGVPLQWTEGGEWLGYDRTALPARAGGKREILRAHVEDRREAAFVGDGMTDLETESEVALFFGYGGVVERPEVAQRAPIYICCQSLSPLLSLTSSDSEKDALNDSPFSSLLEKGQKLIQAGWVFFRDGPKSQEGLFSR